ncbi:ArsR/SmtB family transcription factor [Chryseolinea lacunae]|uniref:Winged helix-turn-helix transcriptional regulator n=1 Tax=Chryseolinea lacunae TaxID=2801331 RepID=A0ABS1KJS7_9BACT|nr:metalloregulator ArsR/SmtB family transcription factor [Chryseolinea lacunae]MBL0739724.1 winged helix-turn-helix transcriptional regulator [Chryseolinea lacunae]
MEEQFKDMMGLIGDTTRAGILWTLMDGKALTATELAVAANTSPQNISMHLTKLVQANVLMVEKQGRHRYFRLSRQDVAYALEAMASLIPPKTSKSVAAPGEIPDVKYCRTCYDHLAGKVGVMLAENLVARKLIIASSTAFVMSPKGEKWFSEFGVDIKGLKQQRRTLLRPCLDWSERRNHLAGALGAALLDRMVVLDWLRKKKHTRAMLITAKGQQAFYDHFRMSV